MSGFIKLYGERLLASSIWMESLEVRCLWFAVLAKADENGIVDVPSVRVLAHIANMPVEATQRALAVLEGPDPDSRTPDEDGRRLVREGTHWRVVNHAKYREIRTAKQVADAERMRALRSRSSQSSRDTEATSHDVANMSPTSCDKSPEAEAEAEAEAEERGRERAGARGTPSSVEPRAESESPAGASQTPSWPRTGQPSSASEERLPGGNPAQHDGFSGDGWTAEAQRVAFVAAYERAKCTTPSMGGKQVGRFHEQVARTAELQKREPADLFAEALQKWLAREHGEVERRAPYACFQAAWSDLSQPSKAAPAAPEQRGTMPYHDIWESPEEKARRRARAPVRRSSIDPQRISEMTELADLLTDKLKGGSNA